MKKSEDDVFLNDGEGYMVALTPYQEHLEGSSETTQVGHIFICPSNHCSSTHSVPLAQTIRLSTRQIQTGKI
jgi:hypothetical protein